MLAAQQAAEGAASRGTGGRASPTAGLRPGGNPRLPLVVPGLVVQAVVAVILDLVGVDLAQSLVEAPSRARVSLVEVIATVRVAPIGGDIVDAARLRLQRGRASRATCRVVFS